MDRREPYLPATFAPDRFPRRPEGIESNNEIITLEDGGFATLYPCTDDPPTASSVNYTPGVNIANATTVALNTNGEVCIFTNQTAHYALDVLAYVAG